MKLDIELFLTEVNDVVRLLLNRCGIIVYQEYINVVWNAKTLPKLSIRKEFGGILHLGAFGARTHSTTFLAFSNCANGNNIPSC